MNKDWFVCIRPLPQAKLRLFCFPYAGGGVPLFREWPDGLPEIEVWAAHLPGRGGRLLETPFSEMKLLVARLTTEFVALEEGKRPFRQAQDRPFAFFGHSLGARLAFELSCALRRAERPLPVHLFISACVAPHLRSGIGTIHDLPRADLLAGLERIGGIPQEILANEELLDLLLPMLRADLKMFDTAVNTPEPPLNCPITAIGGNADPIVNQEALKAWSKYTNQTFNLHNFNSDHFFIQSKTRELLHYIQSILWSK